MSEPNVCLKCDEIITFCECDESIVDNEEYLIWSRQRIFELEMEITELQCGYR